MLKIKSFNDNKVCNVLLGIFNPYKHELPEYLKYDVTKLKDHLRVLEVILNRGGTCGDVIGLYFDGAVCDWAELPRPENATELQRVYNFIYRLHNPAKAFFALAIQKVVNLTKRNK